MKIKSSLLTLAAMIVLVFSPVLYTQPSSSAETMPPWIVLVLKLVSTTHVQPTTGIVLSDTGLVLIPAEFAEAGDEILVLDGGVDIIRYGRPAKIQHQLPADGITIIQVEGLKRRPATFGSEPLSKGDSIELLAYPPAELIAQGARPVREKATIESAAASSDPRISPATALPNVTGAILDRCNNLLALHSALGVQSMTPSQGNRISWTAALQRAAKTSGLVPVVNDCPTETEVAKPKEPESEPESVADQATEVTAPPEPVAEAEEKPEEAVTAEDEKALEDQPEESTESEDDPGDIGEEALEELESADHQAEVMPDTLPPDEQADPSEDAQDTTPGSNLWMVFAGIAAILFAAWLRFRHQRRKSDPAEVSQEEGANPPIVAMPDPPTVELPQEIAAALPSIQLQLVGQSGEAAGAGISLPIHAFPFSCEIGRAGAAINLDYPSISRRHARVDVDKGELTLTDLGSTNGCSINGIPCLEGETLFVEPEDDVLLGDVRLTIRISAAEFNQA